VPDRVDRFPRIFRRFRHLSPPMIRRLPRRR
jgi:hypothetical protein